MGMSKNIGAYADIPPVLDAALAAGGATFRLESPGQALRWRQRAHFYRALLHKIQAARLSTILDSRPTVTPYDSICLTLSGSTVVISVETATAGVLLDGEGNPLQLPDVTPGAVTRNAEDEMDEDTRQMLEDVRGELGLEVDDA